MTTRETFDVSGMSCNGCEETVEGAIEDFDGVERAEATHEGGAVEVVMDESVTKRDLATALEAAGYDLPA